MAIRHFLEHYEQLKENISFDIEAEYGRVDSEIGPFSMMTWCQEMLKDKVCGYLMLLKLVACIWSIRITVVRADTLIEIRIRHDLPLEKAECVLVFNGVPVQGKYCGVIKGTSDASFLKLDCKKVTRNQKYDKETDAMERLQRKDVLWDLGDESLVGEKILIDRREYETLKRKAAQLDQVNIVLRGESGQLPPLPAIPSLQPGSTPSGSGTQAPGEKKKKAHVEFQEPSDVPMYNVGDTQCPRCPHKAKTTHALKLHIMKNHQDQYLYTCATCCKGFTQNEGYNTHKLVHAPESQRIPCTHEDCSVTFVSKRNLDAHVKSQHRPKRFFVCSHCTKTYTTRGILSEHVKGCKENPNRIPLYCDLCEQGQSPTFYLNKRVMEHKRDVYGWK